jgi:hypothetical protein
MLNKDDKVRIKGSLEAVLVKGDGTVMTRRKDNLILNVGFDFICNALAAASSRPAVMGYTAVGTGTTAAAATQTALVTELSRKAATYAHTTGTKVFTLRTTFNAGEATGAITEAGICNASSGGIFLDRVTFDVINKAAADVLTTTFQFTLS